jgi:hypothetical protein
MISIMRASTAHERGDDRDHRVPGDPVGVTAQDAVDEAVRGVVDGVLPQQRGGDRHHQHRGDQHRAHVAPADELAVEQNRQDQRENHRDGHRARGEQNGVDQRGA